MKILKIKFKNINSLQYEGEIDFKKFLAGETLFAIVGPTGAGKSTLLDIITCAMYAKTPRLSNPNELMSRGKWECYCQVEFELNSKRYIANWSLHRARKNPKGNFRPAKMELSENGELVAQGVKEVPKKIEEITHLDFHRFTRSMMLAQGQFDAFLKAKESERAKLLEEMTDTSIFRDISKRVYDTTQRREKELENKKARLGGIALLSDDMKKILEKNKEKREKIEKQLEEEIRQLQEQKRLHDNLQTKQDELKSLENEKNDLESAIGQLRNEASEANRLLKDVKDEFENQQQNIKKARKIESELRKENAHLEGLKKRIDDKEKRKKELEEQIGSLKGKIEELEKELDEKEKYLKQHKDDKNLTHDLPVAQMHRKEIERLRKSFEEKQEELQKQQKVLEEVKKDYESTKNEYDKARKEYEEIDRAYQNLSKDIDPLQITRLSDEKNRLKDIENFINLQKEKNKKQKEIKEIDGELEKLQADIKSKNELIESTKETIKALEKVKEQNLLIKKYEEDRKKLQEGKPCPLCGATEHPWAVQAPQIEEEDSKLDEAKERLEALQKDLKEAERKEAQLQERKVNLQKELKKIEDAINKLKYVSKEAQGYEEEQIQKRLQEIERELETLQEKQDEYQSLMQQRDEKDRKVKELQRQMHEKEGEKNKEENKFGLLKNEKTQLQQQLNEKEKDLQKIFEQYQVETLEALQRRKSDYEEYSRKKSELEKDIRNSETNLQEKEKEKEKIAKELKPLFDERNVLQKRRDESRRERYALIEAEDLDEYEKKLRKKVEEKRERYNEKNTELRNSQTQLTSIEENIKKTKDEIENIKDKLTLSHKDLPQKIEKRKKQKDRLLQNLGAIRQKLDHDEKERQRYKEYEKEIRLIEDELRYYRLLNDLIGSADGAKFAKYAQGITFDNLIRLANNHLRYLSKRYRLKRLKKEGNLLDFVVIDGYNADEERPIHTLSGGESFLISLALALGLSDLGSKRVRINSLFLDEGFGTLDAQTLDTVLDTLTQLQNRGKTIGVISHVATIQEIIPKKIVVQSIGAGISKIKY